MSDRVTNAEVEDVLSSIRRLVSEDKRPFAAPSQPVTDGRLVLTPALRVAASEIPDPAQKSDDDPVGSAVEEALASFKHREEPAEKPAGKTKNAPLDMAAYLAVTSAGNDNRPTAKNDDSDADDVAPIDMHAKILPEDMISDHPDESWPEQDDAPDAGAGPNDDIAQADAKAQSLSAKIAALETAIGGINQQWEPDDAGTDAYSGTDAPAMDWEDDHDPLDAKGRPLRMAGVDLDDRIEEANFEADLDDGVDAPDDSETGDNVADAAMEDADAQLDEMPERADPVGIFRDPDTDYTNAERDAHFAQEDQLIDEDTLRELISEVVRAELQGVLGERITRNVRKLVRREINRALAAQDLE